MAVSCTPLATGEISALSCVEILTIPHVDILGDSRPYDEIVASYQAEFGSLLGEVYQVYQDQNRAGTGGDVSLELLWKTEPALNQPFNAAVRLFLVARTIAGTADAAAQTAEIVLKQCCSTLSLLKYDFAELPAEGFRDVVKAIRDQDIRAIVKTETVANLQNQLMPYCYSFDRFPLQGRDLSRIATALTDFPDTAVSVQLIPAFLNPGEAMQIDNTTQILDTLNKGIMNHGVGNISFTLAAHHAEVYHYYADNKQKPLFLFNLLVYGNEGAAVTLSNRLFGEVSNGQDEGTASLKFVHLTASEVSKDANLAWLPWVVNENLINKDRAAWIWQNSSFSPDLYRMPYLITAEEASLFFRLPLGSDRIRAGYRVNESDKGSRTYGSNIINSGDITIGRLRSSARGDTIGISLKDLAKHMLIVGTPGSGKTTFSVSLLDRLWKEHRIPFLVIEPAKNEYRALIQSIPELQVFTPGKNFISPFVYNPFVPPKNVKLETYKSSLKTAFAAGVSMTTPLDLIFEEAVNNCYSDFRWLDTYTSDDRGRIFNISDFIRCFQRTFDDIGYTGDARNIGRAGTVRLKGLANLFDSYHSIPIEDLLQKPTVIELAAIENSNQKALIIALLLLAILSYVNANYVGEGGLRNVILLEEAHVLMDTGADRAAGDADPGSIARGLLKRMLAEIRSYGVGLLIADQSPRKVGIDVVALTDMKMVFRQVESEDKQIIGNSTNMNDAQIQRMGKLKPGEAFLFFNRLDEPEEVITPDYRLEHNISVSLTDASIAAQSTYWNTRRDKLRPYPQCAYSRHCGETCDLNRRTLARDIARRLFVRHFRAQDATFEPVKELFGGITAAVRDELDGIELTPELMACVKVHLWRRIFYETHIPVQESQIQNSVSKS